MWAAKKANTVSAWADKKGESLVEMNGSRVQASPESLIEGK